MHSSKVMISIQELSFSGDNSSSGNAVSGEESEEFLTSQQKPKSSSPKFIYKPQEHSLTKFVQRSQSPQGKDRVLNGERQSQQQREPLLPSAFVNGACELDSVDRESESEPDPFADLETARPHLSPRQSTSATTATASSPTGHHPLHLAAGSDSSSGVQQLSSAFATSNSTSSSSASAAAALVVDSARANSASPSPSPLPSPSASSSPSRRIHVRTRSDSNSRAPRAPQRRSSDREMFLAMPSDRAAERSVDEVVRFFEVCRAL